MSLDFSVKPIGAPVAAGYVAPTSDAAAKAVATELPASKSVTAIDKPTGTRLDTPNGREHRARTPLPSDMLSHDVVVDRDAASIVYRVVDNRTSAVVRQFPDDAILRRRAYFHALDRSRDVPAPLTAHATDRTA